MTASSASEPAGLWPSPVSGIGRIDVRDLLALLRLYGVLVLFELSNWYMLEHWFSQWFGYFHMGYDNTQPATYFWICVLTPLSVLPAGTRLVSASQVILSIFMTFVGLATPLFFVPFVAPAVFHYVYLSFFLCYLLLAISTRLRLSLTLPRFPELRYRRLLWVTVIVFVVVFAFGMTQDFHLVGLSNLYESRYSNSTNGAFVQRIVTLYVFSFGGFFLVLALTFRAWWAAAISVLAYILCYGMLYEKTAALAPFWFLYMYLVVKFFSRDSAAKLYLALAAPFYLGFIWFLQSPTTASPKENIYQFAYMGYVMFRSYALPANAAGLYHLFFLTHPHTFWSHITGVNFFIRYPYGDHTVAIEMERYFSLGNYNASFIASDAVEAYGYPVLPFVGAVVGAIFVLLNTAFRGLDPKALAITLAMPTIAIVNVPFSTSLLTSGIIFLSLYVAWMPQRWVDRSKSI